MRTIDLAGRLVGFALATSSAAALAEPVAFQLYAPQAQSVSLTGSFAAWQAPHVLRRGADGSWSIILDLPPGRYEYAYLVDGRWMLNPSAPILADGLGGRNNIVIVAATH